MPDRETAKTSPSAVVRRQELDKLSLLAASSPRKRQHCNLHETYADRSQRLLNAVRSDSYIQPHKHGVKQGSECLLALRGRFVLILFDDNGGVVSHERFGAGADAVMVHVFPDVWHTVLSLDDDAVLFEVKGGPFDPREAKFAAPWAPAEDDEGAKAYLRDLQSVASVTA